MPPPCRPRRGRQMRRAAFKACAMAIVVAGACTANLAATGAPLARISDGRAPSLAAAAGDGGSRRLADEDCGEKRGWGVTVGCIVGVLYLFLAIAIICDELFVPALEVIAEKWELSDDVAGATLMAAGGSAPELATSFVGTFKRSTVGFGTIVGSAVFNVLFVIGMCAIFTPPELAPLQLTWWPLFRDCSYYSITLVTLGAFFRWGGKGEIMWWEALIQFVLYFGYVSFMAVNERIERHVKTRWLGLAADDGAAAPAGTDDTDATTRERAEDVRPASDVEMDSSADSDRRRPRAPSRPANFRAGIGRLLMGQSADFLLQTGVVAVTQIAGDVDATFDQLDADQSGELDLDELGTLLGLLGDGEAVDPQRVDALRAEIDGDGTGTVRRDAFRVWYLASEQRLRAEARRLFDEFDTDRSGDVDLAECEAVLAALEARWGVHARCGSAVELLAQIAGPGAERATFDAFHAWYQTSIFYERAQAEAELQAEATKSMWRTTVENVRGFGDLDARERVVVLVCLPLNAVLGATVPDCTVPGNEKWCYATFLVSIAWIGAFAWLMVEGIEIIGRQIGVPVFIMALTFLAAGTSVPDLLSSVVVARQGKGDMAVSSSIGSNIFDVAVGLPLPWLCYTIYFREPVKVAQASAVFISVGILLFMVLAVIFSIMASGWKMSRALGVGMFGLYLVYVGQEILRAALANRFGGC
mmetsp:Transcript_6332/g.16103  ORF Transcript_6332/g.16103 Transcript_6332/m.16103 type:complete len:701 (+) Transcript_6332:77-2179(+)